MKLELLIVDANVLIDFCKTDISVLTLVTKHVGVVHVAEPVLAEVKHLDRVTALRIGLHIVQADFALMTTAATASTRSPLTFQDWLCLLLAERERWTCVTNDKRLRAECESRRVPLMWSLQLLIRLVETRALPTDHAIELAEAMHRINRRLARDTINDFTRKVKRIR